MVSGAAGERAGCERLKIAHEMKDNSFLPDIGEMAAKKSAIFSLPFHLYQVKKSYPYQKNL
jgi:hypothetical protein